MRPVAVILLEVLSKGKGQREKVKGKRSKRGQVSEPNPGSTQEGIDERTAMAS